MAPPSNNWNASLEEYQGIDKEKEEPQRPAELDDSDVVSANTIIMKPSRNMLKGNWRPLMAYQYILICLFDFMFGPIATMIYHGVTKTDYAQWQSLTLQGGGMYHISMGAILGISTWMSKVPDPRGR